MFISCRTQYGTLHSHEINSIERLLDFLSCYPGMDYKLQVNQIPYELIQTGRCQKREYPKIIFQKSGHALANELSLTVISDLDYFLSQHPGNLYYLEIDTGVYKLSK